MLKYLAFSIGVIATLLIMSASPALAAKPHAKNGGHGGSASVPLGNDISYPQCERGLPSGQAFGVVGVNGGLATTTNPCLADQLIWARGSTGSINSQDKTQLYLNTANPGGLNTPSWPHNNIDPVSNSVTSSPYGDCDGSLSDACAWQYGWNRASEAVSKRFIPAAALVSLDINPASYIWWLDVETTNTWETGSDEALARNANDLRGMVDYLKSANARVGIYSTGYQWGKIAGSNNPAGAFNGLASWLAGARNQKGAAQNCGLPPLTYGGQVTLTQFVSGDLDYDYSCN